MNDRIQMSRNKGSNFTAGKIIKGTLNQAPIKLKVSSIPSKMEKMVYRSYSQPAFGDSTSKLSNSRTTNDSYNPGPANYNVQHINQKVFSRKGFGSFASSTATFRTERSRTHVPGPGTYTLFDKKSITSRIYKPNYRNAGSKRDLNSSQTTAALSSQIQAHRPIFKNEIDKAKSLPGPGLYQLNPEQKKNSTTSLFNSKTKRFSNQQTDFPPVGAYDLDSKPPPKKPQIQYTKQSLISQTKSKISDTIQTVFEKEIKQGKLSGIGPESYDPLIRKEVKGFRMRDSILDRFGNLKQIYNLAKNINVPSKEQLNRVYDSDYQADSDYSQPKGLTSMFKSATKRSDVMLRNQMDPCTYSHTKSPAKKSHLINFQRKWV